MPKGHPSPGQAAGRLMVNVDHFSLLNVSSDLVPVPSPKKERELSSCMSTRDVYVTEPQDDCTLRLRLDIVAPRAHSPEDGFLDTMRNPFAAHSTSCTS